MKEDSILIYKSTDSIVSFSGWTNTNGAPLTQYGDANVVYDFTFTPFSFIETQTVLLYLV